MMHRCPLCDKENLAGVFSLVIHMKATHPRDYEELENHVIMGKLNKWIGRYA